MALIRAFELRAQEMYQRAKIGGYCHLNLGEEATVVGLMSALRAKDYLFANYRVHGYAITRGLDPGEVMAELFGRTDGVSGGWGGSMHLFDEGVRLMGGYGIVGGQLPPATGAALAIDYEQKADDKSDAVMCLLGDGTTAIGAFHESLNIAGLWNLPIVYVIINNGLGMGTTVDASSAEPDLYKRGAAYRIPSTRVDGNDPDTVRKAAEKALKSAREDRRPYLLETTSERLKGHSVVDPAKYRTDEENKELKENDPVPLYRSTLIKSRAMTKKQAQEIDDEAERIVDDAVAFADKSPSPKPEQLFDNDYSTAVAGAPKQMPGDPLITF
ncbi:thiamine pyrophosphate-dependent enzyme [Spelaeicoccus albus]|uniref:Pyruvate dehydrogenase E1 component alpha subunit n=1 Tax=Spelaeicoccus albus TaxID=1280376 RepID=A0A7Z0D4F6_9MICO|nr:thiamine pyrophosphate-dependent enzyme [Spelaeicoccus albus]NYI68679.1 pyruvate dehydrogenase E1 component alpha subunit [Spelaeicoccus albus]